MLEENKSNKRLLTIDNFIAEYGPCRTVVYELIGSGALQAVKLGRRTYVPREAAEAWAKTLAPHQPRAKYPRQD